MAANEAYFENDELKGVTTLVNARRTVSAASKLCGNSRGKAEIVGKRRDGVDECSDLVMRISHCLSK